MSQKIHPFFRQTAGEAQALYERKRIADMLICSNWMRHPTLTVKATFTSGEVNFNNSIIDHFRLSDSDHTQTSLRKYTIGPEIFSHTAWFYRWNHHFSKRIKLADVVSLAKLVGGWLLVQQMWFLKAVNARGTALSTNLMADAGHRDPRAMLVTEIGGARPPNETVLD